LAKHVDVTALANAKTEAEVDAAAAQLNAAIQQSEKSESKSAPAAQSKRLEFLDELRGLCILVMMFYHLCFILGYGAEGSAAHNMFDWMRETIQPVFAALFILVAGYCTRFSRDLKKRGLILTICALLITLATRVMLPIWDVELVVWFGILHFFAASKLFVAFGDKILKKIPAIVGVLLSLLLFNFTSTIRFGYFSLFNRWWQISLPESLYSHNALAWLGFHTNDFAAAQWDLVPLLPYLFLFLFGAFLSRLAMDNLPKICYRKNITPFGWLGRHSLILYLLHMPVMLGAIYLFNTWIA